MPTNAERSCSLKAAEYEPFVPDIYPGQVPVVAGQIPEDACLRDRLLFLSRNRDQTGQHVIAAGGSLREV